MADNFGLTDGPAPTLDAHGLVDGPAPTRDKHGLYDGPSSSGLGRFRTPSLTDLGPDTDYAKHIVKGLRRDNPVLASRFPSDEEFYRSAAGSEEPKAFALKAGHTYGPSYNPDQITLGSVAGALGKAAISVPVNLGKDVASFAELPFDVGGGIAAGRALDKLSPVDYSTLRAQGLSHEAAKAEVSKYIDELQHRSAELLKHGVGGQEHTGRAAGLAAGLATGAAAAPLIGAITPVEGVMGPAAVSALKGVLAGGLFGAVQGAVAPIGQTTGRAPTAGEVARGAGGGALTGAGVGGALGLSEGAIRAPEAPAPVKAAAPVVSPVEEVAGKITPARTMPGPSTTSTPEVPAAPETDVPAEAAGQVKPAAGSSIVPNLVTKFIDSRSTQPGDAAEILGENPTGHLGVLHEAMTLPDMTTDELAAWPKGQAANDVDVVRAKLLRASLIDQTIEAAQKGDDAAVTAANDALKATDEGYQNLRGMTGKALSANQIIQFNEDRGNYLQSLLDKKYKPKAIVAAMQKFDADFAKKNAGKVAEPGLVRLLNKGIELRNIGLFSSPKTLLKKVVADAGLFITHGIERRAKAIALDLQGKPEAARAAERYAFGTSEGFQQGWKTFLDSQKYSRAGEFTVNKAGKLVRDWESLSPVKKGARFANFARQMGAITSAWNETILDSEVKSRAFETAQQEGLTGPALAARVAELAKSERVGPRLTYPNMDEAQVAEAQRVADEFTGQENSDKVLRLMNNIAGWEPGGVKIGRVLFPVIKFPYNLTRFGIKRTPLGLLAPSTREGLRAGGDVQAEVSARLAVGTLATMALWSLAQNGQVTGAYPTDPEERKRWAQEGIQANSVKVGGRWISYKLTQPLGQQLALIASAHEAFLKGKDGKASDGVSEMVKQLVNGGLDTSFFDDMGNLFSLLGANDPYEQKSALNGLATSLFPNIVRDVRKQVDPNRRVPTNVKQAVENVIPGLSERVNPRVNAVGEVETYDPSRLARETIQSNVPSKNPALVEANRLGWVIPKPPTSFSVTNKVTGETTKVDLDAEVRGKGKLSMLTAYRLDLGLATRAVILKAMKSPEYQQASDAQKLLALKKAVAKERALVEAPYKLALGIDTKAGIINPTASSAMKTWLDTRLNEPISDKLIWVNPDTGKVQHLDPETGVISAMLKRGMTQKEARAKLESMDPDQAAEFMASVYKPQESLPSMAREVPGMNLAGTKQDTLSVPKPDMTPPWMQTRSISTPTPVEIEVARTALTRARAVHKEAPSPDTLLSVQSAARQLQKLMRKSKQK